jgi:small subunit ribosomal protein S6
MLRIREYETTYIMRPDVSDQDADRITDRVRSVIRAHDGKIIEVSNWGKRKLAYEIAKHQKGIYVYWRYVGNNSAVQELERNLRMLEPVLRFLTVQLEEEVNAEGVTDLPDAEIPLRTERARADATEDSEEAPPPVPSVAAKLAVEDEDDEEEDEEEA